MSMTPYPTPGDIIAWRYNGHGPGRPAKVLPRGPLGQIYIEVLDNGMFLAASPTECFDASHIYE